MNDSHIKTLAQVHAFLEGTHAVAFSLPTKPERYEFIRRSLIRFRYHQLPGPDKGLLLSFMTHVSGYSRVQVKRLVKAWLEHGKLRPRSSAGNGFARQYTDADQRLLAKLDELHGTLSGPATRKLCERAWQLFGLAEYQRLAGISVAHLYNLRRARVYQRSRRTFEKTRGTISERYLIPALEQLLDQFPFVMLGFHADNGSEYINRHVVKLLKKLHFFPVITTNAKGKQVKTYPYKAMMTPFEKLKSLDGTQQYLKPGITLETLDAIAMKINDNEAAKRRKEAKQQLFKTITEQNYQAA